ncbi:hypothetical protein A3K72_01520 [Candidatus Woesearchaeota archaeon RBG_13_36_6]|nr:MAG: hypothetical protein A3K72_01520 [Candidatus Woesearchaeota archaeon RBG_13_36_6]
MKQGVVERLKEITRHNHVKLTNSGNSAIFLAFYIAKKNGKRTILIPDQGGWLTYKTFPEMLGLNIKEIKTEYGLVNFKDLKNKADNESALIIASIAGYMAEQPLKEISKVCKQKECLLIEDAAGAIGHKELCNGNYSDIIVGSFGRWKPVNLEYGGFISTNNKDFFDIDPELFIMFKFHEMFCKGLLEKLDKVGERTAFLRNTCEKIKRDLKDFDMVHRRGKGLVVVVKFEDDLEKQKLIKYCKQNKYEYTMCPRYIRVLDKAISIEVKRL